MKRNWKLIAPLALTALGALAAGLSVLLQKTENTAPASAGKAAPAKGPVRKAENQKLGSYSFISGFKNAATVEVTVPYDAETESFSVVEEDFISPSDDSHVALLWAEDYTLRHMTGVSQTKEEFLRGLQDGTFRYFTAEHERIDVDLHGDTAEMIGCSRVLAAVYGGGRHNSFRNTGTRCLH